MEVADRLGVNIDHGCLAGVCGRCKIRLLSGDVQMETSDGLSESDKAAGLVLACQAKPVSDVVVALE